MKLAGLSILCLTVAASWSLPGCESFQETADPAQPRRIEISEPTAGQLEQIDAAESVKDAGDYDQALRMFQAVLAENPTVTTAYLGIGEIYMVKQDYEKAEPAYNRAARLEPSSFDAQYGHGLALQMLSRFLDAIRAYHLALTIRPEDVRANLNIATVYLQLRDAQTAVTFAERAVELDPENGPAHANLGAIYETLGRYDEAVASFDAALELMGNQPKLMMNQISVLTKQKRYREAVNTALALIRVEPSGNAYERLGWSYFRLGEYDNSIDAYRNAVELDPQNWPALNGLGVNALNDWLMSDKQRTAAKLEARQAFRRSLRINTDQPKLVQLMLNYNL